MNLATLRMLFDYNDWGRDRLMALAAPLSDADLDRPFEMGPGSIRATMYHLYAAEWLWFRRWHGYSAKSIDEAGVFATIDELWQAWREFAAERDAWFVGLAEDDLKKRITYTNTRGDTYDHLLGVQMLHVCNHGTHHRAQVLNMLRHVGVEPPMMDFVVMVRERELAGR